MDIEAIKNAITELEGSETTVKNVEELACLYILRDHLSTSAEQSFSAPTPPVSSYPSYLKLKRDYQRGIGTKDALLSAVSTLCAEIVSFSRTLYACSDCEEERTMFDKIFKNSY